MYHLAFVCIAKLVCTMTVQTAMTAEDEVNIAFIINDQRGFTVIVPLRRGEVSMSNSYIAQSSPQV